MANEKPQMKDADVGQMKAAPARERDTRKILQGVQIYHTDGPTPGLVTYVEGQEDELEKCLTSEQHERLKKAGAISGNWNPQGSNQAPPMQGSRAEKVWLKEQQRQAQPSPAPAPSSSAPRP